MKSNVWGGANIDVTQGFDVNLPNVPDEWYRYSADWGLSVGDHAGLDVAVDCGTPLYSPVAGDVVYASENLEVFRPGYVEIAYTLGSHTEHMIFGHMNRIDVRPGDHVTAGTMIGLSGQQTRRGTRIPDGSGCHVHVERRDMDRHVVLDPTNILTGMDASPVRETRNWPTAEAIDQRIGKSMMVNGRVSKLKGMGSYILELGHRYGINPGVVVAIMQKESQLGADGSILPREANNFAGITGDDLFVRDRKWEVYGTPKAGVEAVFKLLDSPLYRDTDGTLGAIIRLYSPPSDGNDWGAMFRNMAATASDLGIVLNEDTPVYGGGGGSVSDASGGAFDLGAINDAVSNALDITVLLLLGGGLVVVGVLMLMPDSAKTAMTGGVSSVVQAVT